MGSFIRYTEKMHFSPALYNDVYLRFEDNSATPASTSTPHFDNLIFENNQCLFFSFPKLCPRF